MVFNSKAEEEAVISDGSSGDDGKEKIWAGNQLIIIIFLWFCHVIWDGVIFFQDRLQQQQLLEQKIQGCLFTKESNWR